MQTPKVPHVPAPPEVATLTVTTVTALDLSVAIRSVLPARMAGDFKVQLDMLDHLADTPVVGAVAVIGYGDVESTVVGSVFANDMTGMRITF